MASTYPLEVVEAARFVEENPDLKDEALDEALKAKTWDPSVKSLVSFPQVLTMMNEKLDWTQKLGDAFLAQQKDVMDAVQRLRAKAHAEGNLESTKEQKVIVEQAPPTEVTVEQAPTQVVVEQAPPPDRDRAGQPAGRLRPDLQPDGRLRAVALSRLSALLLLPARLCRGGSMLSFGAGMAVGAAIWGDCDWDGGDVDINVNEYNNFNRNTRTGPGRTSTEGEETESEEIGEEERRAGKRRRPRESRATAENRAIGEERASGSTTRRIARARSTATRPRRSATTAAARRAPNRARRSAAAPSRGASRWRARAPGRCSATSIARTRATARQRSARDRARRQLGDRAGAPLAIARETPAHRELARPRRRRAPAARVTRQRGQRSGSGKRSVDRSRGSDAFKGVGQGSQVRRDSSRGHSSRASARGRGGGRAAAAAVEAVAGRGGGGGR